MDKRYYMAGVGSERIIASGTLDVRIVSVVHPELYEEVDRRCKNLQRLNRDENLYRIVQLNFQDFDSAVMDITTNAANYDTAEEVGLAFTNLNRHILNFLSSVR